MVPLEVPRPRPGALRDERLEPEPLDDSVHRHAERRDFLLYPPSESNTPIPYGSNGHRFVPSIRLELMRDGLEDYEYLYAVAGGAPQAGVSNAADPLADRIIGGLTAYNRNGEYFYELRRQIGLYLGGETAVFPAALPPAQHPRAEGPPASFYVNFQDPAGQPLDDPLVVDGKTYMKIGWQPYSTALGYGWYGDFTQAFYAYVPSGPNPLQRSILYDDYRADQDVRVRPAERHVRRDGLGRVAGPDVPAQQGRDRGDAVRQRRGLQPFLVRTFAVTVTDHKLTLEMGGDGEYTMLNYLDIASPTSTATGCPTTTRRCTRASARTWRMRGWTPTTTA